MSKIHDDAIYNLHEYGIYYPSKTIFLFGDICPEIAEATIMNLHILDQMTGEVTIKLMTDGGSVEAGLAIFDAIRAMKNYVKIIAYGGVSSMGSVIFQAGDTRVMMPDSYLMIHYGQFGIIEHPINKKNWEKQMELMNKRCDSIYLEKIQVKKPRYDFKKLEKELLMFDTILTPEKAIEYNLADKIQEGSY